jgi:hypothetical protein
MSTQKHSDEDIREIVAMWAEGYSGQRIADLYGTTTGYVSQIVNGGSRTGATGLVPGYWIPGHRSKRLGVRNR